MRNFFLVIELGWASVSGFFSRLSNPYRVECAWCKKELGGNRKSETVSHGTCFGCAYRLLAVKS